MTNGITNQAMLDWEDQNRGWPRDLPAHRAQPAAPPAPLGGLTEALEAVAESALKACDHWDANCERGDPAWLNMAGKLRQLRRDLTELAESRLTAPRAEGVDAETIGERAARALVAFYRDAEYDADGLIVNGDECMRAALTAAAPKVGGSQADAVAASIGQWATALANVDANEGRWATCSGCYESVEGYPAPGYPFSAMLGCTLGAGCHECGGLGAVWDQTDYAAMAEAAAPQAEAGEVKPVATLHADGYWTWKGTPPYESNYAGWKLDVYAAPLAQPAAQGGDGGFYLASFKHPIQGGEVLWWRPNNAGYTTNLDHAGIYTEIKPGYHDSEYTVPVPVEFVRRATIHRSIDPGWGGLNMEFRSAESLRAAIAALAPQRSENADEN